MRHLYLDSIVAVSSILLISSCAASQDGKYRLGDLVNEVVGNTTQLTQTTPARTTNATDLTRYIEPMLNNCQPIKIELMVEQQKQAIADYKILGNPNSEGKVLKTVYPKNAVILGHPVSKIERLRGFEWGVNTIYFKNSQFVKLRSAFYNTKNAKFNTTNKSISCTY